jgi:preprotein translocase subunit SecF
VYDLVGKRNLWFAISAILTLPGLLFIVLGGLRPSIDFTGGTEWEVRYESEPSAAEVRDFLLEAGYEEVTVTQLGDGYLRIRTEPIDLAPPPTPEPPTPSPSASAAASSSPSASPTPDASAGASGSASADPSASPTAGPTPTRSPSPTASPSPTPSPSPAPTPAPQVVEGTEFGDLQADLVAEFGPGDPRVVRTVGPVIGADLIRSSAVLIIIGELFILGYLWMRFGFRYGTAAIVSLLHDVLLVVGVFAILGFFTGLEFDALFVTALLTIIGFSVHDTIVVFDRIRENRVRHAGEPFGAIVNHSILQTAGRSIITSLTVVVTLGALLLLGPPAIRTFTFALLLGVISGTYSSIFNASQILVAWDEWDKKRKARERTATPSRI